MELQIGEIVSWPNSAPIRETKEGALSRSVSMPLLYYLERQSRVSKRKVP